MRRIVAMHPYDAKSLRYMVAMQSFIESEYEVIDYQLLKKKNYVDLFTVKAVYLNWIENIFTEDDRDLLIKLKKHGVKIIWFFHNRLPHEAIVEEKSMNDIRFLINISHKILLHSTASVKYLKEYEPCIKLRKTRYIEVPDLIDDYGHLKCSRNAFTKGKEEFVFALYGAIRPYKNIEILIEAFNRLDKDYSCKLLIAGQCSDEEYRKTLLELTSKNDKIELQLDRIEDVEMASYIEYADIFVLPYNLRSSMNSGVMVMAFSYKKTVIVPNIAMAEDFPQDLFYKYEYNGEEEHIKVLSQKMQEAYLNGKEQNEKKGKELYRIVEEKHSKKNVKKKLLRVFR